MRQSHIPARFISALLAAALCAGSSLAQPAQPPRPVTAPAPVKKPAQKPTQAPVKDDPLGAALTALDLRLNDGDKFEVERPKLLELWHWMLAWSPTSDADAFRPVFTTLRSMEFAGACDPATRQPAWKLLRAHPGFAGNAAFVWHPKKDQIPQALAVGLNLEHRRPKDFEKFANLAAAICVVRDRPLEMHLNENAVKAPPPEDVFDFFISTNGSGAWPVDSTPTELLMHVADVVAPIEELQWAQSRYFKDAVVGNRYNEINYDINHFQMGTPKKISEEGMFNLPNIKKFGGVCVDQAYFASEVGKAIGIPSVYVTAESTDVGHAWVGFLRTQGNKVIWDFTTGRFEDYKRIRGDIINPQYGGVMSDGELAVLTEALTLDVNIRRRAAVLAEGAIEMRQVRLRNGQWPVTITGLEPPKGRKVRPLAVASELELLEAAVKLYPACPQAWAALSQIASAGELSDKDREKWATKVTEVCGQKFPDVSSKVLITLIKSVKDIEAQNLLWDNMAHLFQTRPDLAADARLAQASMWEKAKNPDRALKAYKSIIDNLLNEGAFAITALDRCEELYAKNGAAAEILPLYKNAYRRVQRPGQMNSESIASSSWHRIGTRYADLLEQAGQVNEANTVRTELSFH